MRGGGAGAAGSVWMLKNLRRDQSDDQECGNQTKSEPCWGAALPRHFAARAPALNLMHRLVGLATSTAAMKQTAPLLLAALVALACGARAQVVVPETATGDATGGGTPGTYDPCLPPPTGVQQASCSPLRVPVAAAGAVLENGAGCGGARAAGVAQAVGRRRFSGLPSAARSCYSPEPVADMPACL